MPDHAVTWRSAWFAHDKFRPALLPGYVVSRQSLHDRLDAGAAQRLTVVVGPAGSGKSVLLSSWAAARAPGSTSWLACDQADLNPVRFWAAFLEAPRVIAPSFGEDAAELLALERAMSSDAIASIANDAAKLPPGAVVIVDDFHTASSVVADDMMQLVERWPAETTQLVLASRSEPAVRLHRLRMAGELCELGNDELSFSLAESRDLLGGFGVELGDKQLALLHQRSEGWAAALQMAALSLTGASDPSRVAQALTLRSNVISEYFVGEVLDRQPPDVAQFMLDISILGQLTADSCTALTGRADAARVVRALDSAHLFLVPLTEARTTYRYHHLVREILRAELHARDPLREQELQLRAAEWFEVTGNTRGAIRCFLAARRADRALVLIEKRVVPEFLANPAPPWVLDLKMINPSLFADAPDQLLAVAAHLLLSGETSRGAEYLDLLERTAPRIPRESRLWARLMALRSIHYALSGDADQAVRASMAARSGQERRRVDDWHVAVLPILLGAYTWLEDFAAVEREAATAAALPGASEPVKRVAVPAARALALLESGRLNQAGDWARAAETQAWQLGFNRHFFAVGYVRTLAGLALERRDLETAEGLTEQALTIADHGRPAFEFLALLDQAQIAVARGHVQEALSTIDVARSVLAGTTSILLRRADELEALIRLSAGHLRAARDLALKLPRAARELVLARIELAAGAHDSAAEHLRSVTLADLTPRRALMHQLLGAAIAIDRADPAASGIVGGILETARDEGYLNSVITAAPQLTNYLVEYLSRMRPDPYIRRLSEAAIVVRESQLTTVTPGGGLIEPLTEAELHVLRLLPTSSYARIAATLYVTHNTVKTHVRAIYRKLGVGSRSDALRRAIELHLI